MQIYHIVIILTTGLYAALHLFEAGRIAKITPREAREYLIGALFFSLLFVWGLCLL